MSDDTLPGAIELPDGRRIRGRGLRNPTPAGQVPEYGLYLGGKRMRGKNESSLTWNHTWIEWPDFLLPRDREQAIENIRDLHRRAGEGQLVEVACGGGVGRTGTVMSCLAILSGVPAGDAITWVRDNYHRRAVETPWQRSWIARFPAG